MNYDIKISAILDVIFEIFWEKIEENSFVFQQFQRGCFEEDHEKNTSVAIALIGNCNDRNRRFKLWQIVFCWSCNLIITHVRSKCKFLGNDWHPNSENEILFHYSKKCIFLFFQIFEHRFSMLLLYGFFVFSLNYLNLNGIDKE